MNDVQREMDDLMPVITKMIQVSFIAATVERGLREVVGHDPTLWDWKVFQKELSEVANENLLRQMEEDARRIRAFVRGLKDDRAPGRLGNWTWEELLAKSRWLRRGNAQ